MSLQDKDLHVFLQKEGFYTQGFNTIKHGREEFLPFHLEIPISFCIL